MKKLIYCILLALLGDTAFSQSVPGIVLTQITEENGLSDNHVKCVLKDREGFVWIGTADGLNLLDGSTITVFRRNPSVQSSIAGDDINALAETADGNIWIATGNGVSCYQRKTRNFVSTGLPQSPYGASNIVRSLLPDAHGQLWCGTDGGLYSYDLQSRKITAWYNRTQGEPLSPINKIQNSIFDSKGNIWLATFDGLWLFDGHSRQFSRAAGRSNDAAYEGLVTTIYEDGAHRIWFGNWSTGLKLLDTKTGRVKDLSTQAGGLMHITGINEMPLPDGRTIICLNGALNGFDTATNKFLQLPKPSGLAESPIAEHFYRSADGWMWMCAAKGVFVYNPQRQFFRQHFFPRPVTTQSLSFFEWKDQLLIGGQGADFLKAYNEEDLVIKDFAFLLKNRGSGYATESLLNFSATGDHKLLIGTSGGILRYDAQTGAHQWFVHKENDSTTLPKNFIQHIFIDSRNQCWVFPWREGIYRMDPSNGACRLLCRGLSTSGKTTKGLLISDAAEDGEGNIWMSDLDEGIIRFDRASGTFSKPFAKELGEAMRSARIFYRNGWCYSFANDRLLKWNTATKALQSFPLPAQAGTYIYDMVIDGQGNWWLATRKGLFLFTEPSHSFQQFTTADGLVGNDMDGSLYLRQDGSVLFGSSAYYIQFNPASLLHSSSSKAALALTGLEANGEELPYDSTKGMELGPAQNNLLFRWAVTDYTNPFHNQYYCQLQGIDEGWKYIGNKGEIQYANLSPGHYTLLLKGATANGGAPENSIRIPFTIHPPFWKRTGFLLLCLALAALVIYLLVSRRIREIKKKAAIEKQMSELELKALKAQMNPHFIFNSLSSIQESIVSGKTGAASKYLGKFSKLIRAVLENSDRKLITLQQEIDYLKLYLELESFRFDDFSFSLEAPGIDDLDFIKIPPMLVQPYVENAIKHGLSHKEGSKKLAITFTLYATDQLQVFVEDNGIGRARSAVINESRTAAHRSMGMKITEERLQLQKTVAERPVEILDLTDANGEGAGTRITIYLAIEN